jgi:hypothetical protein
MPRNQARAVLNGLAQEAKMMPPADCPTRLTADYEGFMLKSELERLAGEKMGKRSETRVSKLMAVAIATRINGGFFLEFILFEFKVNIETLMAARREWPDAFKKTKAKAIKRYQKRKRKIVDGACRAAGHRRGICEEVGTGLLPFTQDQPRDSPGAV